MKRYISIFFLVLVWIPITTQAQDIITKRDGSSIQTIVVEVNQSEVKYKSFSNQDGPLYVINKSDIILIQYANGENEVFEPVLEKKNVVASMPKYSLLKNTISYSDYVPGMNDKYSPVWCGVASFVLPGLGQAIGNEWGRAAVFFVSNTVLLIESTNMFTRHLSLHYYASDQPVHNYPGECQLQSAISLGSLIVAVGINIWSIVDAVRIAKVKNVWHQRATAATFDFYITPSFSFVPQDNLNNPLTGLSLTLNF